MPTLLQKFVRLSSKCLGNANQTGQGKIVFGAFNAADVCPVHIGTFGERFLRQCHFFPESSHIFCHSLAILGVHAGKVWKKKAAQNIDVSTIAFNTRQLSPILLEFDLFPECHRKTLDTIGKTAAGFFSGKNELANPTWAEKGGNFKRNTL